MDQMGVSNRGGRMGTVGEYLNQDRIYMMEDAAGGSSGGSSALGKTSGFFGGVASKVRSARNDSSAMTPEAITQREWQRFRSQGVPMIQKLAEADNTIVNSADREGAALADRTEQQIRQVNGRRIGTMSAAQQRMIKNNISGGAAATAATNSTNARILQRDLNDSSMVDAYNYANAIGNQGLSTLTGGTNMKMQREAQNKANSKSFMSSALGMVGTVAGGMIGGPLGASIGGAVGSGIGGGI